MTKSMHSALQTLNLSNLYIVTLGKERYLLAEKVTVLPVDKIEEIFQK